MPKRPEPKVLFVIGTIFLVVTCGAYFFHQELYEPSSSEVSSELEEGKKLKTDPKPKKPAEVKKPADIVKTTAPVKTEAPVEAPKAVVPDIATPPAAVEADIEVETPEQPVQVPKVYVMKPAEQFVPIVPVIPDGDIAKSASVQDFKDFEKPKFDDTVDTVKVETQLCIELDTRFKKAFSEYYERGGDPAQVENAYYEAKEACEGLASDDLYEKDFPELVMEKYYECFYDVIKLSPLSQAVKPLTDCLKTRSLLDSTFKETKSAAHILCEHFLSGYLKEVKAKNDATKTQELWNKVQEICPKESFPQLQNTTLSRYMSNQVSEAFANFCASPTQSEAEKNDFLALLAFWRSFGKTDENDFYASITDIPTLDEFLKDGYQKFFQAYSQFKKVLTTCTTKLEKSEGMTDEDRDALEKALALIGEHATADNPPIFASKEVQSVYRVVRNTMKDDKSIDRLFFEHYDEVIRSSMLGSKNFSTEKSKARKAYEMMQALCGTLPQKYYGKAATLDETWDFKLADSGCNFSTEAAHVKKFKEYLTNGKFHILNISEQLRDMLLLVGDKGLVQNIFKNLDYDCNVSGPLGPFVAAFSEYAHARRKYIRKEFTDQTESDTEYESMKQMLENAQKHKDLLPKDFKYFKMPPKATANQVPVICSTNDELFIKRLTEDVSGAKTNGSLESSYELAKASCTPYKDFTRKDFDGNPVSYVQFYAAANFKDFQDRLVKYVAEKLKKLQKPQRVEKEYSCGIIKTPITNATYKTKIDALVGKS